MGLKELPQIEGFDFEYAMDIFQDENILKIILVDFYDSLDELCAKLNGLYDTIRDGDAIALYRMEVHALKSTSASVGALKLSEQAKELESAAIEKNVDKIKEMHPFLIKNIIKHKELLAESMLNEEERK